MQRLSIVLSFVLVSTVGCRLPPERDFKPFQEEGAMFSYQELIDRARTQAAVALEAFYVDDWENMEQAARGLEQTARFLPRSSALPSHLSAKDLTQECSVLGKEAARLTEAAREKSVNAANQTLQRINLQIRMLWGAPKK